MDQLRDMLRDGQAHLLTMDTDKHGEATREVFRTAAEEDVQVVYTHFGRPYTFLTDWLSDTTGLDTVLFIDPISRTVQEQVREEDNVLYVDSPSHLTEINIAISTALDEYDRETVVVLDAVTELSVHNPVDEAAQFLHHLTNELRSRDTSCILLAAETENTDVQAMLRQNADEHVNFDSGDELAFS